MKKDLLSVYPEILRATHAEIVAALVEADMAAELAGAIALDAIEWIRKNWGGRTLTKIWWLMDSRDRGPGTGDREESEELPDLEIRRDPVKSLRGRELRSAVLGMLLCPGPRYPVPVPCRMATIVAAAAEEYLTGDLVYIPKAEGVDRALRDQKVWRRFSSLINIDQVIAESGLAQSQIYAIKRRVQKARDEHEQPALPGVLQNKC